MNRLGSIATHTAFWLLGTLLFSGVQAAAFWNGPRPLLRILLANAIHCGLWTLGLAPLARMLPPLPRTSPHVADRLDLTLHCLQLAAIAVQAALVVATASIAILAIVQPSQASGAPLTPRELRSAWVWILQVDIVVALFLISALRGLRLWTHVEAQRKRAAELEHHLTSARLDALRMQLSPHFLFNTLNSVAALVTQDPDASRRMIASLGDFLRSTLEEPSGGLRSLDEELRFARLYLSIEKERLGDRLRVDYDYDRQAARAQVPHLLLQPVFENAIRHGVARCVRPCRISFQAAVESGMLILRVVNDRPTPPPPPEKQPGLGLANVRARLKLHFGAASFVKLVHAGAETTLEIRLPYLPCAGETLCGTA
ncbi:MAG: histidine kinase [Acidobacteria bacterium]|nr:histidine kinase [Acidobacteriota bacterium]